MLKDDATHNVPARTLYIPEGQAGTGRPALSLRSGAVCGISCPSTLIPAADIETLSPARAAIGFSSGLPPSRQPKRELSRYPRSCERVPNGSGGQNSTNGPSSALLIRYRPIGTEFVRFKRTPHTPAVM